MGSLRNMLGGPILPLRHVQSAVAVAIAALRRENGERDEDVTTLLQRCVCDRIEEPLEKLQSALPLAFPSGRAPGPRIHARALAVARTRLVSSLEAPARPPRRVPASRLIPL